MRSFFFGAFIEYLSLERAGPRWRTATATLVANFLVIVGVIVFRWPLGVVMFLYWSENIVIWLMTLVRMVFRAARHREWLSFVFSAPFFTLHFGFFAAIQAFFGLMLAGMTDTGDALADALSLAFTPTRWTLGSFADGLWPPFILTVLSHLYSLWKHTIQGVSSKSTSDLVFEPYGRIVVMHVTVLVGFWLVNTFSDLSLGPMLLMMAAKTLTDFAGHFHQHKAD